MGSAVWMDILRDYDPRSRGGCARSGVVLGTFVLSLLLASVVLSAPASVASQEARDSTGEASQAGADDGLLDGTGGAHDTNGSMAADADEGDEPEGDEGAGEDGGDAGDDGGANGDTGGDSGGEDGGAGGGDGGLLPDDLGGTDSGDDPLSDPAGGLQEPVPGDALDDDSPDASTLDDGSLEDVSLV